MAVHLGNHGQLIRTPLNTVWARLTDTGGWHLWVTGIHSARLLETPKENAIGEIQLFSGSSVQFRITHVNPLNALEWERPFHFGTRLIHKWCLTRNAEGMIVTQELRCEGRFERAVTLMLQDRLAEDLKRQSSKFKSLCESRSRPDEKENAHSTVG